MKNKVVLISLFVVLFVIGIVAVIQSNTSISDATGIGGLPTAPVTPLIPPYITPQTQPTPIANASNPTVNAKGPGIDGIKPSLNQTDITLPNITSDDVTSYITKYGIEGSIQSDPQTKPTIDSIQLQTNTYVSKLLARVTGLADNAPVYLVIMKGSFSVQVISGAGAMHFSKAFELFDARTGNILGMGQVWWEK